MSFPSTFKLVTSTGKLSYIVPIHGNVLTPTTLAKILGYSGMTIGTGTLVNGRLSTATVLCYGPTANPGDSQVITNCLVGEIRYSGARRVDLADGVVYNAGVNGIIYYDTYANGTAISPKPVMLVEPSSTNYLLQSNNFALTWNKSVTVTQNQDSPLGTSSAWTCTDTSAGLGYIFQDTAVSTGTTYTLSCLIKKTIGDQSSYPVFSIEQPPGNVLLAFYTIDTSNGILTAFTSYPGFTILAGAASECARVSDTFWKIAITVKTTSQTVIRNALYIAGSATSNNSTAAINTNLTGSIVIAQLQLVNGYLSSDIQTTSAAVTRAVDSINIPYTVNFQNSIIFAIRFNRSIASPTASAETYLSATGRTILAKAAAGTTLNLTDGTNTATATIPATVQTDYIFAFIADTALAQMSVLVSGDGGATWTTGTTASYDGSFNGSSILNLLPTIVAPTNIIGVMTKSQPFGSIAAATDWIKTNAAMELS